ncbi:hypothetical protein RWH45_04100 [Microbacterium sp. KSW4-17]|uniref:Uncharacterized protein n=1 Tax=Microbacterium galbum TaxID=3075994 RepID=A0ABU3T4X1_9MICO|nr:hypothetical protein [Microbacterium sp. KSW4-17]MDU0366386.1 hypothetical protein [Microbacterium sp. KSW4-17]
MNDLRKLVGSSTESDGNARSVAKAPTESSALRDLVGAAAAVSVDARAASESSQLRALVGESASHATSSRSKDLLDLTGGSAQASSDDSRSALTALVGGSRPASTPDSRAALSALVGAGGKSAEDAGWQAPELAQVGKRPLFGGRRKAGAVNYLSVAAAVVAVLAIVGTASFAVVQRATANPADDAMVSLREREAELANDTKVLQTAADLYDASVTEAVSLAQASESVLVALQGRVDGAALGAAEAARGTLLQASATATSVSIPEYQRASIDEKSLADVGKAIDGVRLARESLPTLITDARDARSQITAAVSAFKSQLATLGSAIKAEADKLVTENDSAAQSFRAAVTDAAGRVTAAQQAGGDGLAEMPVYAAAVDALRAENQRVLALEEAERERTPTQQPTRNPGSGGSNSGGGSTNPAPSPSPSPSESTPPTQPTDPPTDTPTDPPTEEPSLPPIIVDPPTTGDGTGTSS